MSTEKLLLELVISAFLGGRASLARLNARQKSFRACFHAYKSSAEYCKRFRGEAPRTLVPALKTLTDDKSGRGSKQQAQPSNAQLQSRQNVVWAAFRAHGEFLTDLKVHSHTFVWGAEYRPWVAYFTANAALCALVCNFPEPIILPWYASETLGAWRALFMPSFVGAVDCMHLVLTLFFSLVWHAKRRLEVQEQGMMGSVELLRQPKLPARSLRWGYLWFPVSAAVGLPDSSLELLHPVMLSSTVFVLADVVTASVVKTHKRVVPSTTKQASQGATSQEAAVERSSVTAQVYTAVQKADAALTRHHPDWPSSALPRLWRLPPPAALHALVAPADASHSTESSAAGPPPPPHGGSSTHSGAADVERELEEAVECASLTLFNVFDAEGAHDEGVHGEGGRRADSVNFKSALNQLLPRALALLEALRRVRPRDARLWFHEAKLCEMAAWELQHWDEGGVRAGLYARAARAFARSEALEDPTASIQRSRACAGLAEAHFKSGNLDGGLSAARRAVKLHGNHPELLDNLFTTIAETRTPELEQQDKSGHAAHGHSASDGPYGHGVSAIMLRREVDCFARHLLGRYKAAAGSPLPTDTHIRQYMQHMMSAV